MPHKATHLAAIFCWKTCAKSARDSAANEPNCQALKFNPNTNVLPEGFPSAFLEYMNPRSTLAPPHPSPLAAKLFNVDGITSVFFGSNYITVSKDSSVPWAHIKPEVFSLISEYVASGQPMVNVAQGSAAGEGQESEEDSLAYNEDDDEVVGMIKELLETRIRPAIQEDGGDIEFRGFQDGIVMLKLRGACRTCDSSTVTLKNGIESMLMHYITGTSYLLRSIQKSIANLLCRSHRCRASPGRGGGSCTEGVCEVRGEAASTEGSGSYCVDYRQGKFGYCRVRLQSEISVCGGSGIKRTNGTDLKLLSGRKCFIKKGTYSSGQELQVPISWCNYSSIILLDTLYERIKNSKCHHNIVSPGPDAERFAGWECLISPLSSNMR